jgi:hypothetical protein
VNNDTLAQISERQNDITKKYWNFMEPLTEGLSETNKLPPEMM